MSSNSQPLAPALGLSQPVVEPETSSVSNAVDSDGRPTDAPTSSPRTPGDLGKHIAPVYTYSPEATPKQKGLSTVQQSIEAQSNPKSDAKAHSGIHFGGALGSATKGGFGAVGGGLGKLGSGSSKLVGGITGGVEGVASGVTRGVGGVATGVGGVATGVGGLATGVVSTAGGVVTGVATGVGDVARGGANVVGGGVGALGDALNRVPGMQSMLGERRFGPDAGGGGRSLQIDQGEEGAPDPTVDMMAIQKASEDEEKGKRQPEQHVPGGFLHHAKEEVVGWLSASGYIKPPNDMISSSDDQRYPSEAYNWITEHIPLQPDFYGTVYHNSAIIIFAVLATRVVTVLRFGWIGLIIVLAFCSTMYSVSIERTRARARDDCQRELVKVKLIEESESAEWVNSLLNRAWLVLEPVLSATIVATADEALKGAVPAGIESVRMTTFTLGNKAPKIDSVRTYPNTPDDEIVMEWGLSFTPNDIEDLTPKQARGKVNPKIVLSVKIGASMVGATMPILLEDLSFKGMLRIKLKLISNFPHVSKVQLTFMEKPDFDYVLKPIGGEKFGMDINSIPGLSGMIKGMVHSNLGPLLYSPNIFTIDLESLLSGTPLDSAIGVLQVTVESARGLKATKLGGGDPDCYVALGLASGEVARTRTIKSSQNPRWNENKYLLINTLTDTLSLSVFDYNEVRADDLLGVVSHELTSLSEDAEQRGIVNKILSGGKDRGEVRYSLNWYPTLVPTVLPSGELEELPETATGIARLTVHQAKELDLSRVRGTPSAYAKVYLGKNQLIHTTPIMKTTNSPSWESHTEFLVADRNRSVVSIRLFDDHANGASLGDLSVKLTDLIAARQGGTDWFPLQGLRSGKLRLALEWKPLNIPGGLSGASAYTPPIGVMRIFAKGAQDVKNVEAALGGKSDPYLQIRGPQNRILAKTEVVNNDLNPTWGSIVYAPVHLIKDRLLLEVMDYENLGKDRSLGSVELKISDYAKAEEDRRTPYSSLGRQSRKDPIYLGPKEGFKGFLVYEAEFVPCINLKGGISFDSVDNNLQATVSPGIGTAGSSSPVPSVTTAPNAPNTHSLQTIGENSEMKTETPEEDVNDGGVAMTKQEILASQSGLLVCQMISGNLTHRGRLEVLIDGSYWPAFGTQKARSHDAKWNEIGEGLVRELDFSKLTLRMNKNETGDKEEIFAELKGISTKDFLERAMGGNATFQLHGLDGDGPCTVVLSAKWVPVPLVLEPRETINNEGNLLITLIDGKDIRGVDRSGKSDPYVVFLLDNDEKVYKSQVQKKTLNPVWNEQFSVTIKSRVDQKLSFSLFDWDRVGAAELLGSGDINIADLEPFELQDLQIPVHSPKHGDKGRLHFRVVFTPEVVARTRKATSAGATFTNGAGRAMTTIGSAPINVGKGVKKGVFSTVGSVVRRKSHHDMKATGHPKLHDESGDGNVAANGDAVDRSSSDNSSTVAPLGQALPTPSRGGTGVAADNVSVNGNQSIHTNSVNVSIKCIGAKDLGGAELHHDVKPYVQMTIGKKTFKTSHAKQGTDPRWEESFSFTKVSPDNAVLNLKVLDHKTLGKDKELGEATVNVSELCAFEGGASTRTLILSNGGHLEISAEMTGSGASGNSIRGGSAPPASSPSRFHKT